MVLIEPSSLEIARGHDGLLRGQPDPTVIVGAYRVGKETCLLGRVIIRAEPRGAFPVEVRVTSPVLQVEVRCDPEDHIAVLAIAVEEDSGDGVKAVYAALEDTSCLLLYRAHDPVPEPAALLAVAGKTFSAPAALPVEVLFGTQHAREVGKGDDLVGGSVVSTRAEIHGDTWRFSFVDRDAKNDWALVARLRIR